MRAGNRTRLHFLPLLRKKTEVQLRQAVAGGARPRRVYIIRVLFLPNNKGRQFSCLPLLFAKDYLNGAELR